jgi:hypothetical protein
MRRNRLINNSESTTTSEQAARPMTTNSILTGVTDSDSAGLSNGKVRRDGHDVFTVRHVAAADALVAASGVVDMLAGWRREDGVRAGVPRVPERAILAGLLLLAREHAPLTITCLAEVFQDRLTGESSALLGLPVPSETGASLQQIRTRWYSNTRHAFDRMLAVMDPLPISRQRYRDEVKPNTEATAAAREHTETMMARLDGFTNAFLRATTQLQPARYRETSDRLDLAIGEIMIRAPKPQARNSFNTIAFAGTRHDRGNDTDVQGRFRATRALDTGWARPIFVPTDATGKNAIQNGRGREFISGWMAQIAVRADSRPANGRRFPHLVVAATLCVPFDSLDKGALRLLQAASEAGLTPGLVDTDMGYDNILPERFSLPVFNLGFTPTFEYSHRRLGVQGAEEGALWIEGAYYFPSIPKALQNASRDYRAGVIDERTYRLRIELRTRYQLHPRSRTDRQGRMRMMIPSGLATEFDDENFPVLLNRDFTQKSMTLDKREWAAHHQAFTYKSKQWEEFHQPCRRLIETVNSRLQGRGNHNIETSLESGVTKFAAIQVLMTMLLTDYNLKTIAQFEREAGTPTRN